MPVSVVCSEPVRVVNAPGLSIDELAGNVATRDDRISIAFVTAAKGTSEPWLTLHYDEWICVRDGTMVFEQEGGKTIEAVAGTTVMIEKGTRFRPSFPVDCRYVPVCLPAFRPDRCIREDGDENEKEIGAKLRKLHQSGDKSGNTERKASAKVVPFAKDDPTPEILYHMCPEVRWRAAEKDGVYYPETFEKDGYYTHATAIPSRLIRTANHFYQEVPGDWICVAFTRKALWRCGIYVKDEEAMPVGERPVGRDWHNWICPHVMGGIPTHIIDMVYPMTRVGTKFTGIKGLVS